MPKHLHEQKGFFRLELSAIAVVTAAGIIDILYDVICNAHDVLVGVRISDNIQGESKIMEFIQCVHKQKLFVTRPILKSS